MPELPEVETVRAGLEAALGGKTIQKVKLARANLRTPFPTRFAEALAGRNIGEIARRAKYLLIRLDDGLVLMAHLGMSGRFVVLEEPPKALGKHEHVLFTFTDGTALVFNDARRFGLMDLAREDELSTHPLLAALGPEPLGKAFTPAYLADQLKRRGTPVKVALMDQAVVVGVGNIYASEALFEAGLDPRIPAKTAAGQAGAIIKAIRKVLKSAIETGGSSLRDFLHVGGETGYFQHSFKVYGREGKPCFTCSSEVKRIVQGGRSTFFCPACQKPCKSR